MTSRYGKILAFLFSILWLTPAYPGSGVVLKGDWQYRMYVPPLLSTHNVDDAQPLFWNNHVFVGSAFGKFCAFDVNTGRKLWCSNPAKGKAILGKPLIINNILFVGGYDGCIHKLDPKTGRPLKAKPFCTDGVIRSAITSDGTRIFFSTNTGKTYALNARDLSFVWQQQASVPVDYKVRSHAGVLVAGNRCFVGFYTGRVMALNCASGDALWEKQLGDGSEMFQDILFTPLLAGHALIVSGYKSGLVALSPDTGKILWKLPLSAPSIATRMGRNILVSTADKQVFVLSQSGKVLKHALIGSQSYIGPPIATTNNAIILPVEAGLLVLDSGLHMLTIYAVSGGLSSRPAVFADKLYFMDNRGVFNCLEVLEP